jgi:hypothetical protein
MGSLNRTECLCAGSEKPPSKKGIWRTPYPLPPESGRFSEPQPAEPIDNQQDVKNTHYRNGKQRSPFSPRFCPVSCRKSQKITVFGTVLNGRGDALPEPLQAFGCTGFRDVFAADPAFIAEFIDQVEEITVVDFSAVRFMALRDAGDLKMANQGLLRVLEIFADFAVDSTVPPRKHRLGDCIFRRIFLAILSCNRSEYGLANPRNGTVLIGSANNLKLRRCSGCRGSADPDCVARGLDDRSAFIIEVGQLIKAEIEAH